MLARTKVFGILTGLSFLVVITPNMALAQQTGKQTSQFTKIEQPIGLKIAVIAVGLSLISGELWWFLYKQK